MGEYRRKGVLKSKKSQKALTVSKQAFYRLVFLNLLIYASTAALKYKINLQYYFKTSNSYNKIGLFGNKPHHK